MKKDRGSNGRLFRREHFRPGVSGKSWDESGGIVGREGAVRRIGTGPGVLLRRRMLECLRFN